MLGHKRTLFWLVFPVAWHALSVEVKRMKYIAFQKVIFCFKSLALSLIVTVPGSLWQNKCSNRSFSNGCITLYKQSFPAKAKMIDWQPRLCYCNSFGPGQIFIWPGVCETDNTVCLKMELKMLMFILCFASDAAGGSP